MATLGLPQRSFSDHGIPQVVDPKSDVNSYKFPHTRAQLAAIARHHKTGENYEAEPDGDELGRVPWSLVSGVVSLLVEEKEEELKALLKETFELDDERVEENVLDLMHKHRDDVAGVPFLFLTPTRRPISRPSSRASSHSARLRPDTPSSAPPSPLAWPHRRPHTPATSPLANPEPRSYMTAKSDYSPSSSPVLSHAQATQAQAQWTASLPASPLLTSRSLNAKASEFRPIPRPLSSASSQPGSLLRADTPSPDMWAHNSPRATSNLAIAAPLIADQSTSAPKPITPSSSLRSFIVRPEEEEEEESPYEPFTNTSALPPPFHSITVSDFDSQWSVSPPKESELAHMGTQSHYDYGYHQYNNGNGNNDPIDESEANASLTDGMTPFDVLGSVFGSSLAPSELEEALAANGYDFERAMAWLIDRVLPSGQQPASPTLPRAQPLGNRVSLVPRDAPTNVRGGGTGGGTRGGYGYHNNGNNGGTGRGAPRYVNGRPPQSGNRVCRYFIAGECLRADCRFSHDLERALCRFWLRGICAKNETCEFLHHLPKDADVASLNVAMSRVNIRGPPTNMPGSHEMHSAAIDEFPVLGYEGNAPGRMGKHGGAYYDPSRTRFAAAVKKQLPPQKVNGVYLARVMGPAADNLHHQSAIVAPRPSPRVKLRAPTLLPTLPTGEAVSNLYMTYRQRALQLGAARNACLSRAADAWRRGDGAAAKRFSREGHELNGKMASEMASAASKLVRERARLAEQTVRGRDLGWSDDPGDRSARGKQCGSGLGVVLGVARRDVGDGKLTTEERTECMLDLHGLHSNEATEVLEQFLLALESEHFYGLAYAIVGEEKHTGTQDPARGASRNRLATSVREWVHRWGYPWSERDGIICIDPLTHASE